MGDRPLSDRVRAAFCGHSGIVPVPKVTYFAWLDEIAALEAKLADLAQEVLVVGNGGTISEIGERFRVLHAKAIAALEEGDKRKTVIVVDLEGQELKLGEEE